MKLPAGCRDYHEECIRWVDHKMRKLVIENRRDQHNWRKALMILKKSQDPIFKPLTGANVGRVRGIPTDLAASIIDEITAKVLSDEISVIDDGQHILQLDEDELIIKTKFFKSRKPRDSIYALLGSIFSLTTYEQRWIDESRIKNNARNYTEHLIEYDYKTSKYGIWGYMKKELIPLELVDKRTINRTHEYQLTANGLKFCYRLFYERFHPSLDPNCEEIKARCRVMRDGTILSEEEYLYRQQTVNNTGNAVTIGILPTNPLPTTSTIISSTTTTTAVTTSTNSISSVTTARNIPSSNPNPNQSQVSELMSTTSTTSTLTIPPYPSTTTGTTFSRYIDNDLLLTKNDKMPTKASNRKRKLINISEHHEDFATTTTNNNKSNNSNSINNSNNNNSNNNSNSINNNSSTNNHRKNNNNNGGSAITFLTIDLVTENTLPVICPLTKIGKGTINEPPVVPAANIPVVPAANGQTNIRSADNNSHINPKERDKNINLSTTTTNNHQPCPPSLSPFEGLGWVVSDEERQQQEQLLEAISKDHAMKKAARETLLTNGRTVDVVPGAKSNKESNSWPPTPSFTNNSTHEVITDIWSFTPKKTMDELHPVINSHHSTSTSFPLSFPSDDSSSSDDTVREVPETVWKELYDWSNNALVASTTSNSNSNRNSCNDANSKSRNIIILDDDDDDNDQIHQSSFATTTSTTTAATTTTTSNQYNSSHSLIDYPSPPCSIESVFDIDPIHGTNITATQENMYVMETITKNKSNTTKPGSLSGSIPMKSNPMPIKTFEIDLTQNSSDDDDNVLDQEEEEEEEEVMVTVTNEGHRFSNHPRLTADETNVNNCHRNNSYSKNSFGNMEDFTTTSAFAIGSNHFSNTGLTTSTLSGSQPRINRSDVISTSAHNFPLPTTTTSTNMPSSSHSLPSVNLDCSPATPLHLSLLVDRRERQSEEYYRAFYFNIRDTIKRRTNLEALEQTLDIGDFHFVLKTNDNDPTADTTSSSRKAVVKMNNDTWAGDVIIERKCISDLISRSTEEKRAAPHYRQERRLRFCGLKKPFLLIEGTFLKNNITMPAPLTTFDAELDKPDVIQDEHGILNYLASVICRNNSSSQPAVLIAQTLTITHTALFLAALLAVQLQLPNNDSNTTTSSRGLNKEVPTLQSFRKYCRGWGAESRGRQSQFIQDINCPVASKGNKTKTTGKENIPLQDISTLRTFDGLTLFVNCNSDPTQSFILNVSNGELSLGTSPIAISTNNKNLGELKKKRKEELEFRSKVSEEVRLRVCRRFGDWDALCATYQACATEDLKRSLLKDIAVGGTNTNRVYLSNQSYFQRRLGNTTLTSGTPSMTTGSTAATTTTSGCLSSLEYLTIFTHQCMLESERIWRLSLLHNTTSPPPTFRNDSNNNTWSRNQYCSPLNNTPLLTELSERTDSRSQQFEHHLNRQNPNNAIPGTATTTTTTTTTPSSRHVRVTSSQKLYTLMDQFIGYGDYLIVEDPLPSPLPTPTQHTLRREEAATREEEIVVVEDISHPMWMRLVVTTTTNSSGGSRHFSDTLVAIVIKGVFAVECLLQAIEEEIISSRLSGSGNHTNNYHTASIPTGTKINAVAVAKRAAEKIFTFIQNIYSYSSSPTNSSTGNTGQVVLLFESLLYLNATHGPIGKLNSIVNEKESARATANYDRNQSNVPQLNIEENNNNSYWFSLREVKKPRQRKQSKATTGGTASRYRGGDTEIIIDDEYERNNRGQGSHLSPPADMEWITAANHRVRFSLSAGQCLRSDSHWYIMLLLATLSLRYGIQCYLSQNESNSKYFISALILEMNRQALIIH